MLPKINQESRYYHSASGEIFPKKNELKFPKVAMPLRVMVTGGGQSPSVDAVMHLLGKEETLKRMSEFCA